MVWRGGDSSSEHFKKAGRSGSSSNIIDSSDASSSRARDKAVYAAARCVERWGELLAEQRAAEAEVAAAAEALRRERAVTEAAVDLLFAQIEEVGGIEAAMARLRAGRRVGAGAQDDDAWGRRWGRWWRVAAGATDDSGPAPRNRKKSHGLCSFPALAATRRLREGRHNTTVTFTGKGTALHSASLFG